MRMAWAHLPAFTVTAPISDGAFRLYVAMSIMAGESTGDVTVSAMADRLGVSGSTISRRLRELHVAGLVATTPLHDEDGRRAGVIRTLHPEGA